MQGNIIQCSFNKGNFPVLRGEDINCFGTGLGSKKETLLLHMSTFPTFQIRCLPVAYDLLPFPVLLGGWKLGTQHSCCCTENG